MAGHRRPPALRSVGRPADHGGMASPHCFVYEHCDVPAGMTLAAWQRARARPRARRGLAAALRRLAPRR